MPGERPAACDQVRGAFGEERAESAAADGQGDPADEEKTPRDFPSLYAVAPLALPAGRSCCFLPGAAGQVQGALEVDLTAGRLAGILCLDLVEDVIVQLVEGHPPVFVEV